MRGERNWTPKEEGVQKKLKNINAFHIKGVASISGRLRIPKFGSDITSIVFHVSQWARGDLRSKFVRKATGYRGLTDQAYLLTFQEYHLLVRNILNGVPES